MPPIFALVYLALKYENDSVDSQTVHFTASGNTKLRMSASDLKVKEVMGYFYLGQGRDKNTELKLLFMTDVQLIRFHQKKDDEGSAVNAVKSDSLSVKKDSVRMLKLKN